MAANTEFSNLLEKRFDFFSSPQNVTITNTLNRFFLRPSQELPLHCYILNGNEAAALAHITQYGNNSPPYIGNYNESAQGISLSSLYGYITLNGDDNHRYYRSEDRTDIFLQNEVAESALHLAVKQEMCRVVEALLEHRVPINLIDGYGSTPLHLAATIGNEELIILLIKRGASTILCNRSTKARALDLLNEDRTYSRKAIELLLHPDPINTEPENYKNTPLHDALCQNKAANEIKALCQRLDYLVPNQNGERASILAKKLGRESKLVSFLHILEVCLSLTIDYTACMHLISHRKQTENDLGFLRISIELLNGLYAQFSIWEDSSTGKHEIVYSESSSSSKPIEYKSTDLERAFDFLNYNKDILRNIFDLLASCIHNISFALRDKTCDIFPWKNIRALRYLAFRYKENDKTAITLWDRMGRHFLINLEMMISSLTKISSSLDIYENLPLKKDKKDMRLLGFGSIYALTEPIIAERTLYKISNCCFQARSFSEGSIPGRYAIIRAIKMLCEMTLYTHTSRNLSGLIKSFFPSVPWKELRKLRVYLAKNVIIPKAFISYKSLLEGQDNAPFILAKKILSELYEMAQKAIIRHNEYLEKIEYGQYDFERFELTYTLSEDKKDALLIAITAIYEQKNQKARQKSYKNFIQLKQCIERNTLSEETMKNIVNFLPARSETQKFWQDYFSALKKDLGDFKDFFAIFGLGNNEESEQINHELTSKEYAEIGLKIIKQLEEILIGSSDIILELAHAQNLSTLSQSSQIAILNRLELFKENIEFRFCCEQLITDLCTALSKTQVKYDKQFRDYLEHIDDIFETTERDITQGNFFEMLNYVTDVKRKLIAQFGIDSSPQLKQESEVQSVVAENSSATVNAPLFRPETENLFFGMFPKVSGSVNDQKKQQLQKRYKLTDLNAQQLAKGLRNAAANGKLDDLKTFIALGADINAADDKQKKTALHHALEKRHMPCVHWLIEKGADYNIADISGTTAYDYARQNDLSIFRNSLQI